MSNSDIYTVVWICAFGGFVAASALFDHQHELPECLNQSDGNTYHVGRIGKHNVVIVLLPARSYGPAAAAATAVARDMFSSFPNIRICLLVGIGGDALTVKHDVRLGDIVVGIAEDTKDGIVQYDFGQEIQSQAFQKSVFLNHTPTVLRKAVNGLKVQYKREGHKNQEAIQATLEGKPTLRQKFVEPDPNTDRLYSADVVHPWGDEGSCLLYRGSDRSKMVDRDVRDELEGKPTIHYGLIASANLALKGTVMRDALAQQKDVSCFEMGAADLVNHFPCLVICGICDYSDQWQSHAAMAAADYTRDLLYKIDPTGVIGEEKLSLAFERSLKTPKNKDKVRSWLAAPDPSTNFNKAREQYYEGTGQWLLNSEVYTKWKTERNSFLCLYGVPGCGKTILSSSIITDLSKENATSTPTLLYFYFDFRDVDKMSLDKAVRSLIEQLYVERKSARGAIRDLYSSCDDGRLQPDPESLLEVLGHMLQKQDNSELWIVLDALDEFYVRNEGSPSGLMSFIQNLRYCAANVHLLVTSRPERDIQSAIESWARRSEIVSLQGPELKGDINSYIKAKVRQLRRWQNQPDIQNEIGTVLLGKTDGTFRWVSCQFDILSGCLNPKLVQQTLRGLPNTLDDTYERILQNLDPSHRALAIRLLQFLIYSDRPLRLEEAVDALSVRISDVPKFDQNCRISCPEDIIRCCSSLAVMVKRKDEKDETDIVELQLAHYSVQEYLTSDRLKGDIAHEFSRSNANTTLTTVCLSYLLSLDHSGRTEEAVKNYPLAHYSAQYWPTYAVVAEQSAKGMLPIVGKYFASMPAISFCVGIYDPDMPWAQGRYSYEHSPGAALYYASLIGLRYSTQALIDDGADVNVTYGEYDHALLAAIARGHHEIVRILVDVGAKVNGKSEAYYQALEKAVNEEDQETVQILIDHGIHAQSAFECILPDIVEHGNEELVRSLINKGADVNKQNEEGATALHHASAKGRHDIVQLLIDQDADVNAQDKGGDNALQAASAYGHKAIVKILLDHGADVNMEGGHYSNALQAASVNGHLEIVQLLRDKGAVLDTSGDQTMTMEECQDVTGKALSITENPETPSQDNAILKFVSNLLAQVRFEGFSYQAASAVLGALPQLLEAFADRVGYGSSNSWCWEVRYYFHKYRDEIVQCFHDLCDKNCVKPARLESLTGSSDETQLTDGMNFQNKRKAHLASNRGEELLPSDENKEPIEAVKQPIHVQKVAATEDNIRLLNHLHQIFQLPVYRWLCKDLQKQASLSRWTGFSESFKAKIMDELPSDRSSTQRRTESSEVLFYLDWNPSEFLSQQEYAGNNDAAIERAITLTGSPQEAQAMTCADYLEQTWPLIGRTVLSLVKKLVMDDTGSHFDDTLEDTTIVSVCIVKDQVWVKVIGPIVSIAEVGEVFAWMGAALRSSPQASGIASFVPILEHYAIGDPHQNLITTNTRSSWFRIYFDFQKQTSLDPSADGCCWFGLFRNPVLVGGFPIARRSNPILGLDVSLEVITELLDVTTATTFGSTLCIKGYAAMLAAQRRVGDIVHWHALYSNNGRRISYLDERLCRTPNDVKPGDLSGFRHIIGWCLDVNTHIGDSDDGHEIKWSGLDPADGFLQNSRITRYPLVGLGSKPAVGKRDAKEHYFDRISDIADTFVVLYDVRTKRAWLTDGASALVHLLRKSLKWEEEGKNSDVFCLKTDMLNETHRNRGFSPKKASLKFLLNKHNMSLKLFQLEPEEQLGPSETFRGRVIKLWSLLDQISDLQFVKTTTVTGEPRPRSKLEGFNFMDLATVRADFKPCMATITAKGMTWIDWMREAKALTLFGDDFGELVEPVDPDSICPSWVKVPVGQEYLTAHVSDIKLFLQERNSLDHIKHRQLTEHVFWHNPYKPRQRCRFSGRALCCEKCDMAQVLVDKTLVDHSSRITECLQQIGDRGAFVFGLSDRFAVHWQDFGAPVNGTMKETENDRDHHANSGQKSVPTPEIMKEIDKTTTCLLRNTDGDSRLSPSKDNITTERPTISSHMVQASTAIDSTSAVSKPEIRKKAHPADRSHFKIAIICALGCEAEAVVAVFDDRWDTDGPQYGQDPSDHNAYTLGLIGKHNIVVVHMADYGKLWSGKVAQDLVLSFPNMELALVVGVCGAIPLPQDREPIVLGDIIVSTAVIQHDLGRRNPTGFEQKKDHPASRLFPSRRLKNLLAKIQTDSEWRKLERKTASYLATIRRGPEFSESRQEISQQGRFHTAYRHLDRAQACGEAGCDGTDEQLSRLRQGNPKPAVHFGPVGSGDTVLMCGEQRDLMAQGLGIIGIEMEGIGIWENVRHCLVIKGACDYADFSKNKEWQPYAAATAAACAKAFLVCYWE